MKINQFTALLTPKVLLVPYSAHHVPTYHEWMKDEEIQRLTASEPLTIEEEYAMQSSWRLDHDKLTFIICLPPPNPQSPSNQPPPPTSSPPPPSTTNERIIAPGVQDSPDRLIGDVNLFLYEDEDEDAEDADENAPKTDAMRSVIGELEIMIASPSARGKGLAYTSLLAFLSYITANLTSILSEYSDGQSPAPELKYLRVKIGQDNGKSVRLFERLGFERTGDGRANYFGEVEMRMGMGEVEGLVGRERGEGVRELKYGKEE